tara:strand:+ start:2747 stop:3034 length:288 start_codon:yes stop_codon:yes gene_type:complete
MTQRLINLKKRIERMSKYHQVEVLRILKNIDNITVSENKNGSFINLTEVPESGLNQLDAYVAYVDEQHDTLTEIEKEKHRIADTFFNNIKESTHT